MSVILDTNIIIGIVKAKNRTSIINFLNPDNENIYVSVVSEAEAKSLSVRNRWGTTRQKVLNTFLDQITLLEVNQPLVSAYTEIDTYSQRVNPGFDKYSFQTPRNMGKNDLWIASAAALFDLKLITTDADFDHLHGVFFDVIKLHPSDFIRFY